jgi:hypothetical protein
MDEQPSVTTPETPPPSSSLASRLVNIFVAPTEVFDEVKAGPPKAVNWVVPLILAMIVGIVYTFVVFSQPRIMQKIKDANEKKFQQMVDQGKITQKQADEMLAKVEQFMTPLFFKLTGSFAALFINAALLFLIAAILWLLGRFLFQSEMTYVQALQANGLATIINALGGITAMLLAVIYGNMSITSGPVLLVSHFDAANKLHLVLSALNIFALWYVAVLAIALTRLSRASFLQAALWLFGLWAFFTFGPILAFGGR